MKRLGVVAGWMLMSLVGCQGEPQKAAAPPARPAPAEQQADASPADEAPTIIAENSAGEPEPNPLAGQNVPGEQADVYKRLPPPDPKLFPGVKQMSPDYDVWFDGDKQRVIAQGGVCLREGPLELFACIHQWDNDKFAPGGKLRRGTKEYESIVTINTTAALIHTALLAAGGEAGSPARFDPKYTPAHGSEIDVTLYWTDEKGEQQQAPAQSWLRNTATGEAMTQPWVFAGSGFWVNEQTKAREYMAENGNLICVSNFPDAVLDIPVESSQANDALLFEPFTERIPPKGTTVTVVLTPKPKAE